MAIYDYDQRMLVWRDIPNPSHQVFRQNVKHYRDARILGVDTESRKEYRPSQWETLRTDLYAQAQGIRHPDGQSFTGDMWYRTAVPVQEDHAARMRV